MCRGMTHEYRTKGAIAELRYCRKAANNYRHLAEGQCSSNKFSSLCRYWHVCDMPTDPDNVR